MHLICLIHFSNTDELDLLCCGVACLCESDDPKFHNSVREVSLVAVSSYDNAVQCLKRGMYFSPPHPSGNTPVQIQAPPAATHYCFQYSCHNTTEVQGLKTNTLAHLLHHGWALMVSHMFLTNRVSVWRSFWKRAKRFNLWKPSTKCLSTGMASLRDLMLNLHRYCGLLNIEWDFQEKKNDNTKTFSIEITLFF